MKHMLQVLKRIPRKFIFMGLIVLAVTSITVFSQRQRGEVFEYASVQRGDIQDVISASGTLTGKNTIDLKFQKAGKIFSINVKEGDSVEAGQILARLENTEEAIALQQAKNTLRDKESTVDKVLDDIHLFQYGMGGFANVGTESETMIQRQTRTTSEVARDNAFDFVKLAQKALDDTLIFAPTSGIITQVNYVVGQNVGSTDIIIKMTDTSNIYFDAEVDEADIGKVSLGQKAQVTLDAYPDKIFEGTVAEIIPQTKTTSSGANIIVVRIILDKTEDTFINGLTGQAEVILSEEKNVLTIPLEALKDEETVIVQKDTKQEVRKVSLGIKSDTDIEIKEGLNEGEKVILNP